MTLNEIWALIEKAWDSAPLFKDRRLENLIDLQHFRKIPNKLGVEFEEVIGEKVYPELESLLKKVSKAESFKFNLLLEKLLYDLDRKEIHDSIEGSDDTFLYARGFIVAMGKEYYDMVNSKPSKGVHLVSCGFAYFTRALHNELHEEKGISIFGFSRESHSNHEGWGLA